MYVGLFVTVSGVQLRKEEVVVFGSLQFSYCPFRDHIQNFEKLDNEATQ